MPTATVVLPDEAVTSLDAYRALGGGDGLAAARRLGPAGVIDEVEASGLRGRGGAGFPTGRKWRSVAASEGTHRYAVCNAAEGEPATFKDRAILRANPYQVVEGLAIGALAVGARRAYVGVKESFRAERQALVRTVEEMREAGMLSHLDELSVVAGPDEYLYGEETGLLEVVEGRDPLPRLFPPYVHGLFATAPQMGWTATPAAPSQRHRHESNPTVVNNAETFAHVAHVLTHGADWFRSKGTEGSPGTLVCTVVGDVRAPRVVEVEMGTPLSEVLDLAGGPLPGGRWKAALSGVANPVLHADHFDVRLDYESMRALGTGLGAAGFHVYDETACMVKLAAVVSRFLYVESCNQCPPCKLGSEEITERLLAIDAAEGSDEDVEHIGARLRTVTDGNRCYLPVQEQEVVASLLRTFPEEFSAHIEGGGCPLPRPLMLPKITDLADGEVEYDEAQLRKRPDWTYAPVTIGS